eukprot:734629-Pleurochrysis_carterae.AAC.1
MELAHKEEYARHPILRLFTRPEEIENGLYMHMAKENVGHMSGTEGKKVTQRTLQVALLLHERHAVHVAIATNRAKMGGTKDRTEPKRLSETTYGAGHGPDSAGILRNKRGEATALQRRLGDSATAAEAELFAIFATLRKVQAQQDLRYHVPNTIADNIAAKEHEEAPEGMVTGLISKQIRSRPVIYNRIGQGHRELADCPIYQEARWPGENVTRDMHKSPEGVDECEGRLARGMLGAGTAEEEEESDREMYIERQEGKREVEKFVHGIRNGKVVGGPANKKE